MHDDTGSRTGWDRSAQDDAIREIALRIARRRMFSDLSEGDRDALVEASVQAWTHAWGPQGRPEQVEPWLAVGMYHAMMDDFRHRRLMHGPRRMSGALSLAALLEEWLSTEPARSQDDLASADPDLIDRFLRLLSPADARLLWMRCEGYPRDEIADVLGIRANAVNVRLRRLQLRLREALEPVPDHAAAQNRTPEAGTGAG